MAPHLLLSGGERKGALHASAVSQVSLTQNNQYAGTAFFHYIGNVLHEVFLLKRILRKLPDRMTKSPVHGEE